MKAKTKIIIVIFLPLILLSNSCGKKTEMPDELLSKAIQYQLY
jgi:hypothetical protein